VTDEQRAALANYGALVAKVDAKAVSIVAAHADQFACRRGCHSCCQPGLTVNAIEAAQVRAHVEATPGLGATLAALVSAAPHGGTRCALLTEAGACSIYAARPLVCRSHGLPLTVTDGGATRRDVCPLNFAGKDLADIPASDVVNLETLNTLLTLIDRQFTGDSSGSPARVRLVEAATGRD